MANTLPSDSATVVYEGLRDTSGNRFVAKQSAGTVTTDSDGVLSAAQAVSVTNATALGQATMANSSPVVIASDQVVPVNGNHTTIAGNGTGVVTAINTDLISSTDVSGYSWISLQIEGTFVATLTYQVSNDGVTWRNIPLLSSGSYTAANMSTSTSAAGLFVGPVQAKFFRVRATAFTSNTSLVGTLVLFSSTPAMFLSAINVTPQATTAGGASDFHLVSAASTNLNTIKNSAGQVYGYEITNTNAATRYVKLFNKAANPTLGTDTPARTIAVPGNGKASYSSQIGLAFATGIALATTTGASDADATAVGAGDLIIEIDWK